ncbi:DUF5615 family PIN-like protein [bacterium]|nr:DUF5615 family PIN-like protein [bacterium]
MLKFLLDENIGRIVFKHLVVSGRDVISVGDVLSGSSDEEVLSYAVTEKRILITLDKDFAELTFRFLFPHTGIILLRLKDESPENIIRVLEKLMDGLTKTSRCKFIVVSEDKVRMR